MLNIGVMPIPPPISITGSGLSSIVTVHSPLTLTLGFGVLRRPTSSIHGVVSLRERRF
jgi:hypothetical protein